MTRAVKRPYVSASRVRQAEATRRAILDAANRLFVKDGYALVTVDEIAAAAKVAVPTVYKAFGTKRAILERLVDGMMAGDPDARELVEQEWFQEQLDAKNPSRQLELIARNARRMYDRAGDLLRVVRDAAASDPDIRRLWESIAARRLERSRTTARNLAKKRKVVKLEWTADILYSQTAPEMHVLLVRESGWAPERYERWLAAALKALLL